MTLRIVHLFPDEMGIFGDVGNVTALAKRAQWSGIRVSVENIGLSDAVPDGADVYMLGSGSTAGLRAVLATMPKLSRALSRANSSGATIVAIGAGLHVLSARLTIADSESFDGVGLLDATSQLRSQRLVGPVAGRVGSRDVTGYVNSGHDIIGTHRPLIEHIEGIEIVTDGVDAPGILGTHLHGPFLPMNPQFADDIIEKHTGVSVDTNDQRVRRATEAASRSRDALRRELGI